MLAAINLVFLIAGGFIWSGGFLGIAGYGYGWDKTRAGLLVLLRRSCSTSGATSCRTSADAAAREGPADARGGAAHPEFRVAPDASLY